MKQILTAGKTGTGIYGVGAQKTTGAYDTEQSAEYLLTASRGGRADRRATAVKLDIPDALRELIQIDEDDDSSIRLRKRAGNTRSVGVLIIPDERYDAWKTLFPKGLITAPESRYSTTRRVFFAVDDLPADAPPSILDGGVSVFFSGYSGIIPVGEWISTPPNALPVIPYADITRLMGTPAPAPQTTPAAREEGPDGSGIPQELKNANQWLVWKFGERDGKKTKIPLNPKTFAFASAPDATWSYEECKQAADRRKIGIGFSLKNGFVGIDYDHVLDEDGILKPEYTGLMDEITALGSYTEISPSGTGLHVFVICKDIPPECRAGKHTQRGEIYSSGRYFTVTGNVWKETPSRNINVIPADVYRRVYNRIAGTLFPPSAETSAQSITAPAEREAASVPTRTDEEIISHLLQSEKGRVLWAGDTSGYQSASNADAALMAMLASSTGMNREQMKRLFLMSGLAKREKARTREDYIERTIENACKYVSEHKPEIEGVRVILGKIVPEYEANQACMRMAGQLPDIWQAGEGIYVVIDPLDGITRLISSGCDDPFQRWCNHVFPDRGYDPKFVSEVFRNIAVLHTADPIPHLDIEKAITAIPCSEGGYISLTDGKRCERPAAAGFCPFVLHLSAADAEYDPDYHPTGRVLGDLMTYVGKAPVEYMLSFIAACIPRIPANRKVVTLTGPSRSSKTTFGMVLGELGLAPPHNVDFSTEIDNKGRYRPELAKHISQYPVIFVNDPHDPDGTAVKKLCDVTQQYELKYQNQRSIYQRATCVLTMNHPPDFKTSAMENKVFFICSRHSYAGKELPTDEYMDIIRADGSLRDIWQEILHAGLKNGWKIEIPPECDEHNRRMHIGASPLQKWLSACNPGADFGPPEFHTMAEIYQNYVIAVNPDTPEEKIIEILNKKAHAGTWKPRPQDGIEATSKNEIKKNLLARGFTPGRERYQRGFYIGLPELKNGTIEPAVCGMNQKPIPTEKARKMLHKTTQKIAV